MKRGKPVPESDYPFPPPTTTDTAQNFLPPPALQDQQADTQFTDADLLAQYGVVPKVKAKVDETADATSCTADDTATMSQFQQFLTGLTLELVGFNEETQSYLTDWVTDSGGELIYSDFSGELDYLVTPCTGGTSRHRFKQHASSIWLEDCLDQGELLDIAYYHKIIDIDKELRPLDGVVSGSCPGTQAGRGSSSTVWWRFWEDCRRRYSLRGTTRRRGSTHLICPEGVGQKYTAALQWKLPVINCEWLSACLREKKWVCESPFLAGDSTAFTPGKPMPVEVVVEASTVLEDKTLQEQDDTVVDEVTRRDGMGEVSFPGEVSKREELRRKSVDRSGKSEELTLEGGNREEVRRKSLDTSAKSADLTKGSGNTSGFMED